MKKLFRNINRLRIIFSRKDKIQYLVLLLLMIVGSFIDMLGIGSIPVFVAMIVSPEKVMKYPFIMNTMKFMNIEPGKSLLLYGSMILFIIFFLKNMYFIWLYYIQSRLVEFHRVRLADRMFTAYLYAPYIFYIQRNSAELLRNVNNESNEILKGIITPLIEIVLNTLMVIFTIILLMFLSPLAGLLGLFYLGGSSSIFIRFTRKKMASFGRIAKKERREVIKAVNQGLSALVDARILGKEEYLLNKLHNSLARFARSERLKQIIRNSSPHFLEIIAVSGLLLVIISLVLVKTDVDVLLPTVALFSVVAVRLRQSISKIVSSISQMQYSEASISSVISDLKALESSKLILIKKKTDNRICQPLPFSKAIELQNISYYYPDADTPSLQNINLTIRKGEYVGIVGQTGCGKTTLLNILLGLLEPQQGNLTVDGFPIHENIYGWFNHIGYIPQYIFLLDDTIRRNIAFGIEDNKIDEEKMSSAIKTAQLNEFITSLPGGLSTMVGERGVRLSGGQLQRVGIARALYHNKDLLILDEATSALDIKTESLIMEMIENMRTDQTMIIVSHRISTIKNCDKIVFLKDGRIISQGSYNDLLRQNEEFNDIARSNK